MRELTIEDVEQVNGSGILEGLALIGTGITLATVSGIAALGIRTAFAASPIVAAAALALTFAGGWQLMQPSAGVGSDSRESDC